MPIIRRARRADLDDVLALIRDFCTVDRHPFDQAVVVRALGPLLDGDDVGQVWLFGPGDPLGYAVVTWGYSLESGGREALIDEIFVREPGRGVGGAALAEIARACAAAGARRIFLETEAHNSEARRFYMRHGFALEESVWLSMDLAAHLADL